MVAEKTAKKFRGPLFSAAPYILRFTATDILL